MLSDVISRIFAGRLFHSAGAEAENERAPNVDSIRPLGRSKNNEEFDLRE